MDLYFYIYKIAAFGVLPFLLYFIGYELRQLFTQGVSYIFDPWNVLDSTSIVTNFICTLYSILNQDISQWIRIIAACTIIILYLKFFYFLRIFDNSSSLIRIIVQMAIDVRYFIFIFILAIIGFGNGIFIIYQAQTQADQVAYGNLVEAVLSIYNMALGDFSSDYAGLFGAVVLQILFLLSTMLIMIILLNMLIAIMGDTYGQVKETEEQAKLREYLQLIVDNEFLINRSEFFHDAKYIVSVKIDQEKNQESPQELLKKEMLTMLKMMEKRFDFSDRVNQESFNHMMKLLYKLKNSKRGRKGTMGKNRVQRRERESSARHGNTTFLS